MPLSGYIGAKAATEGYQPDMRHDTTMSCVSWRDVTRRPSIWNLAYVQQRTLNYRGFYVGTAAFLAV